MAIQPQETEKDDPFDKFTLTTFDPVQFLNDTLPPLNLTSQPGSQKQQRTSILQTTSTEVQTFLSKLSAHSIRHSAELTNLTDEILRSGNRLAYEVEVLRGDVNSLYELLTESLKNDIARFVVQEATNMHTDVEATGTPIDNDEGVETDTEPSVSEPEFIRQLRVLGTVKSRLEAVIAAFGEALKWPVAPSEVSMASNLISVSAPELGVVNSAEDDRAREYTRRLRNEITDALDADGAGAAGLELATKKVNDLRAISQIWKGTAEEKARTKIVDNLTRLVEDRRKQLEARSTPSRSSTDSPRSSSIPGRTSRIVEGSTNTAAGLFRNLQKLRDEIYMD